MIRFYHNPRCSKSREALKLLQERSAPLEIVEYLKTPPTIEELQQLCRALGVSPRQMMRSKEDDYVRLHLDDVSLEDKHLLQAIHNHPQLLERPIAQLGDRAVIGRPPEQVLSLL